MSMKGNLKRGAKYQTIPTIRQTDKEQLHTGKSEPSARLLNSLPLTSKSDESGEVFSLFVFLI